MKKLILLTMFLVSIILPQLTLSQTDTLKPAIDSIFKANMIDTSVGTVIGIIVKYPGSNTYTRKLYFYGEKDRVTHQPPDSMTVFQIGSVTKTFTAMIMAYMLRYNLANRWDLIQSYLPGNIRMPYWVTGNDTTRITLLDLVTHYAGLVDEPPTSYPYTISRMFSYLDTCHLMWRPDSAWSYSNLGFATLATGLTMHAGRDSIEQLFSQWITDSLGMPDTKITRTLDMILRTAKPYIKNGSGNWVLTDSNKSSWPAFNGAGGIRSTIKDMTRYLEFQMKLTNPGLYPLLDTMHKRIRHIENDAWQGMAWSSHHLQHNSALPWVVLKDGGTPGYNSYIAFYTDTNTGLKAGAVILTNSGTTTAFNNALKVQNIVQNILIHLYKGNGTIGIQQTGTEIPGGYRMSQNFPNPFNPVTKIKFDVASGSNSNVKLSVYDLLGKEVAVLVDQNIHAGSYEVEFDGSDLSSGVYFYKMQAGNYSEMKKMILVK